MCIRDSIKSAFFDNRLNASLSVFHTKQDNVAEADLDNLVPGSAAQAYRAVNGTQSNGFEVELSGQVLPGWNIQAGYAHFNLVGPDGAKLNTALPRNTFNLFTKMCIRDRPSPEQLIDRLGRRSFQLGAFQRLIQISVPAVAH